MSLLRWTLPLMTALAGLAAGRWIAEEGAFSEVPDEVSQASGAKHIAGMSTGVRERRMSAPGELPTMEESVTEARLAQLWLQKDMDAALAAFVAYARVNPARALDLAMRLEGDDAWELVMNLVLKLPPHVGGIAMDALLRHPKYCEACPPFDAVFGLCAKSDPERAWREAHAPGVKYTAAALDAIARGCAETNPRLAMTFAARLTETKQRDKFTRSVLREWSNQDARGLVSWLGTQEDRENLAMQVPWGKMRFETLADFMAMVKSVPPGVLDGTLGENASFGTAVEGGWATRLDWLRSVPEGAARTALFAGAARALIGADPEKVLALVPEITDARLKQQVYSATAAYRAAVSPQEGFAFADAIPDEKMRALARRSVLQTWAENDPAEAARHALASGDKDLYGALSRIGFKWAEIDSRAAVSYALENEVNPFSNDSPWSTMFGTAMSKWVDQDPYAASRWVKDLPEGTRRDIASASLARNAVRSQPDGALQWAAGIADEQLRQATLVSCFQTWLGADRARAAAWLEQTALDETTRQMLGNTARAAQEQAPSSSWNSSNGVIVIY